MASVALPMNREMMPGLKKTPAAVGAPPGSERMKARRGSQGGADGTQGRPSRSAPTQPTQARSLRSPASFLQAPGQGRGKQAPGAVWDLLLRASEPRLKGKAICVTRIIAASLTSMPRVARGGVLWCSIRVIVLAGGWYKG